MPAAPPRTPIPKLARLDLVLETARLRLRALTEADADALWPYVSDPEFPRQMTWTAHSSIEETRGWITAMNNATIDNEAITWAIEYEGTPVGTIGLHDITFQMRALRVDRAELGYWLAPTLWNQGLVTEAATAVLRCAFDAIGLHKVTVGCFAENDASRRVIEKLGFRYVGRAEDDVWRDGQWRSHLRYELTAPEWPDVHTTTRIDRRDLR